MVTTSTPPNRPNPVLIDATSDGSLMQRVADRDAGALGTLYDRYQSMAFGLAIRITGDRSTAEEVVQDAFLGIWRNASGYAAGRASVRTWLMAIVHHRSVDAIRRRRPAVALPDDDQTPAILVRHDIWPEVASRLDRDAIGRAIESLSPVQRDALRLSYFGGLTHVEIAEQTGAPLGTVKSRVRMGLLALRGRLDAEGLSSSTG